MKSSAKEMLAEVLRRGSLTTRERESFTDMWDRIHRYDRCSDRQRAWIEKVYFGQKLDQGASAPVVVRRRVVVPAWQKTEPRTEMRATQPSPITAAIAAARDEAQSHNLVKVSARDRHARRPSSKSGTFRATVPPRPAEKNPQVGYINYPGVQRMMLVTSLPSFEEVCPRIEPGSKQHQKVARFFESGGVVLRIKPLSETQVA